MRCFISINIPKEVSREIERIQDKLPEFKGKKTELENLHLTLKFLGEINEKKIEDIKRRLRQIRFGAFNGEIGELGVFDNRSSRNFKRRIIVWLCLINCEKIQRIIDIKLKGLFNPEKRFMSHLTIARVKNVSNKEKFLSSLKQIKIQNIKFKVNKFYLMKSELTETGPKYEILEEYDLS